MVALMWWQSRKSKQQQQKVQDFRTSLQPGELVQTIGGIIGKVVSVDTKYEEIVIDSEGSKMRFIFRAISKKYERPAYIDDDEVDEDGNPIVNDNEDSADEAEDVNATESQTSSSDDQAQKPFDGDSETDETEPTPDDDEEHTDDASAEDSSKEDAKAEEDSGKTK
ncbi:preprotein translocase subunit YajC [Bifidobacterium sp. ESL0769]|uniref:preprotein translocase subunit YajC n=1 Tax=Bifidobacterium sp. ESL0769 TaxID=2983229 RepID=UPI0032AE95B8